jgi:hypothetical protein
MSSLQDPDDFGPVVLIEVDGVETQITMAEFWALKDSANADQPETGE